MRFRKRVKLKPSLQEAIQLLCGYYNRLDRVAVSVYVMLTLFLPFRQLCIMAPCHICGYCFFIKAIFSLLLRSP